MGIYYQDQNMLFPIPDGESIEVTLEIPGLGKTKTRVPVGHRLVIASRKIDWGQMFRDIDPILYNKINKHLGRKLDLRAHCGIYLLQAMHNWTDRFSEEMLRYYGPARVFCGYGPDSTKSIDHTKIEKFRNRLGKKGAEILNKYILKQAVKHKFTNGKTVDMDTTVQESGITYPTEMKLMKKFQERASKIVEKVTGKSSSEFAKLKEAAKKTHKILKEYQFFAKTKEKKQELISEARIITLDFLETLKSISPLKESKKLRPYLKKELDHLLNIIPQLLEQIKSWLETGKVSPNKIISLYKSIPKFISKGKIGKAKEIGRKWIVNQCFGGFLLLICPENPVIADTDCVKLSLQETIRTYGEFVESYGTDRGMDSKANIKRCEKYGIKDIGVQPKGQKEWQVDREMAQKMYCRRAAIEPRIGLAGRLGLKKSRAKTDEGDIISGQKAGIGFNLKKMTNLWAA